MDFGLSLSLDVETHVSSLVAGTTSHMSPEILMEGKQTKQADVYAFVSHPYHTVCSSVHAMTY